MPSVTEEITAEIVVGRTTGKVTRIADCASAAIGGGWGQGLVHISQQIADKRVEKVTGLPAERVRKYRLRFLEVDRQAVSV
ncbi:hypothetical protein MJ579_25450 [Klebsiella pneumoniae]|nr:hypothetical protein MJ579_25450 [Klebsiella pneumoniae]